MKKNVYLFAEFASFGGTREYVKKLLQYYYENNFKVVLLCDYKLVDSEVVGVLNQYQFSVKSYSRKLEAYSFLFFSIFNNSLKPDLLTVSVGTPGLFKNLFLFDFPMLYFCQTYPHTKPKISVFSLILRNFLSSKKKLITVSEFAKKTMINDWKLEDKSSHVEYLYAYTPREKLSKEKKHNLIVTAGHLEWYKNPFLWIEIAKKTIASIPNLRFIWIGTGSLEAECKNQVLHEDRIEFIGYKKNITTYLKQSIIYIQPSKIESFGLSVLEAMSCGCVPIVSANGGLPEILKNGLEEFIVKDEDPDLYVQKIHDLITNTKKLEEASNTARKKSESTFSKNNWYLKLDALHSSVLSSK